MQEQNAFLDCDISIYQALPGCAIFEQEAVQEQVSLNNGTTLECGGSDNYGAGTRQSSAKPVQLDCLKYKNLKQRKEKEEERVAIGDSFLGV